MQRVYEMADRSGAVCVSIKSDWILVNPATAKSCAPPCLYRKAPDDL